MSDLGVLWEILLLLQPQRGHAVTVSTAHMMFQRGIKLENIFYCIFPLEQEKQTEVGRDVTDSWGVCIEFLFFYVEEFHF